MPGFWPRPNSQLGSSGGLISITHRLGHSKRRHWHGKSSATREDVVAVRRSGRFLARVERGPRGMERERSRTNPIPATAVEMAPRGRDRLRAILYLPLRSSGRNCRILDRPGCRASRCSCRAGASFGRDRASIAAGAGWLTGPFGFVGEPVPALDHGLDDPRIAQRRPQPSDRHLDGVLISAGAGG